MLVEAGSRRGVVAAAGPHFRENLLGSSLLHDLGDLCLGRGICIILPGPLLGSQESGIYAGKIETRVESLNLVLIHFTKGQRHTGAIRTLGKVLPTDAWG